MNTDIIVSSRIRLARNLQDFDFPAIIRGTEQEKQIVASCSAVLNKLGFTTFKMSALDDVEKRSFTERYVISKNLASSPYGAVALSKDGLLPVMINEEDHLREQCMYKGLDLDGAYLRIGQLDKILNSNLRFAVKSGFYYTACPTNLGTGMRASVMAFLPALTKSGKLSDLAMLAYERGITIRGAFGEGSKSEGYYYQISNSVTIGDAKSIIDNVKSFVRIVSEEELKERKYEFLQNPLKVKDESLRAFGLLTHAAILPYEEFGELIARVKIGISLGILSCDNSFAIDDLAIGARPNTLFLSDGIASDTIDEKRATFVKNALSTLNICEV